MNLKNSNFQTKASALASYVDPPISQAMSRHLTPALLALALLTPFAPAGAQTTPGKPLSLEEAVGLALKKNFDIQIQTFTTQNARESFNASSAIFDPTLTSSITRSVSQAASNTSRLDGAQLEGPRNDGTTVRAGVSQPPPTASSASPPTSHARPPIPPTPCSIPASAMVSPPR